MDPIDLDHVLTVLGAAAWSPDERSRARVAAGLVDDRVIPQGCGHVIPQVLPSSICRPTTLCRT
ncbi:hypothetical protein ACIRPQ_33370, partial [Streptomyces sp. NPDC101213]